MSPLIFFLYSSQIQSFRFSVSVLTPSPCGYSPYIVAPHPAMLRDTAGREVAIWFYCCCCRSFLTPPSFGHLPYILLCTTQGRRIAMQPFSPYCFVTPRNATRHDMGRGWDLILLLSQSLFINPSVSLTPPSFGHLPYICCAKHRGGVWYMSFFTVRCVFYDNNIKHSHLLYCCVTRQGECEIWFCYCRCFFNPSVLRTPPLYFAVQNTP